MTSKTPPPLSAVQSGFTVAFEVKDPDNFCSGRGFRPATSQEDAIAQVADLEAKGASAQAFGPGGILLN